MTGSGATDVVENFDCEMAAANAYELLLFISCLFQLIILCKAKRPEPRVVLDIPVDFHQRVKVYDDFVEIIEAPAFAEREFDIVLSYRTREARLLSIELTSIGIENKEGHEFKYVVIVAQRSEVTQTLRVKVGLRDSLAHLENKALEIFPDLYIEQIHVTVTLVDLLPGGLESKPVLAGDFLRLLLVPPWSRPQKPGFSFPWPLDQLIKYNPKKIEKCQHLKDIVDLLTFPVALTGKETGLKRVLPALAWPREELAEAYSRTKPRFTISTWIFIMEPCLDGLCGIFNHRSTVLLTPLVSITSNGQLHIQVQYTPDMGHAFIMNSPLPLKKWLQIVMSVDDTTIYVTIRHFNGHVFEKQETAVHRDFPHGTFSYKDTDGFWVLGGTEGSQTFKGIIGHTRIYRRHLLFLNQVFSPPEDHLMFSMALTDHSATCSERIVDLHEAALEEIEKESEKNENDATKRESLMDLVPTTDSINPQCQIPLSGETPEVDLIVQHAIRQHHNDLTSVADFLYQLAFGKLVASTQEAREALAILRVASCMEHIKSQYMTGIINMIGLGVPQDKIQGWKYLLLCAANDNALCQMALAYRHFLGADGLHQDCDVAIGYYKAAALTTDKLLQEHQEVNTHSEAVRLDDYDELANHKGQESDMFQWLTHQALHGLTGAQNLLAEMYYYGKRGLQRDLNRAVKYYQMGADKGDAEGLYNLGVSMLKGHGVEQNEEEAIKLFKMSAEQDFPPALNALGFYEVNTRQNYSGAAAYFRRAADKGDRDGLTNLAVCYDNGWVEGHPPDKRAAFKYWFEAATKGHPGSCLAVGEGVSSGLYVDRNCPLGVVYLRFVAEQNPEVGWFLRRGLEAHYQGDMYKSLVNFMFAAEVGMEVPLYNAAMLCEENQDNLKLNSVMAVDCAWHYYNRSAAMGWVFAMVKVGDNHWYGKTVPQNITFAAEMYAEAASKNNLPQAVYNLAYMVEYNYSLNGIQWNNVDKNDFLQGNLTFAASLYKKCRDASENNNESFLPCAFGVVRVKLKLFWQNNSMLAQACGVMATLLVGLLTILVFFCDGNGP